MPYIQPKTLRRTYESNSINIGNVITIDGISYTVEIIGAEAVSNGHRVDAIPNRERAIVCAMDENKTMFNLKLI